MSNNFKAIQRDNQTNTPEIQALLRSMHRKRKIVFVDGMGWKEGLWVTEDQEEYDDYDRSGTYYLLRVNKDSVVDVSCRVMLSSTPNMLNDAFCDLIDPDTLLRLSQEKPELVDLSRFRLIEKNKRNYLVPHHDEIAELTRGSALDGAIKEEGGPNVFAQMYVATIKFAMNAQALGLQADVKQYVLVTTEKMAQFMENKVGWALTQLGPYKQCYGDRIAAFIYPVSYSDMENICAKHNLDHKNVFDFAESKRIITAAHPANDNHERPPEKRTGTSHNPG